MRVVGTGTVRAQRTGKRGFMHRYKKTLRKKQVTKSESTCTVLTLIYMPCVLTRRVTWVSSRCPLAARVGRSIAARARYAARGARAR